MPKQDGSAGKARRRGASPVQKTKKPDFPPVPQHFNPLQASPQCLQKYGLPARPDPMTQPNLLRAWERIFTQPATFVRPRLRKMVLTIPPAPPPNARLLIRSTRIADSLNWSGAMVIPSGGNQIVQIYGEWMVPTPDLPAFADELGPAGQAATYDCSTWIGLDGDRQYLDSTLPQVGTTQALSVSAANAKSPPEYSAWFEWWARNPVKLLRKRLTNITITQGMSVMATIYVVNSKRVAVIFRTFAGVESQIALFFEDMPAVHFNGDEAPDVTVGGAIVQPDTSGATAQWIMERPHTPGAPPTLFELFPSYTSTTFQYCVAGTAAEPGVATSEEILTGPVLLRMYEVPPDPPPRTRIISVPELQSTTSVEVRYGGL